MLTASGKSRSCRKDIFLVTVIVKCARDVHYLRSKHIAPILLLAVKAHHTYTVTKILRNSRYSYEIDIFFTSAKIESLPLIGINQALLYIRDNFIPSGTNIGIVQKLCQ